MFKKLIDLKGYLVILLPIFFVFSYLRIDAEFIIFLSVFLVVFSVWNILTDALSKMLFVKVTLYYYYFVRYYQGRLWLIYLLSKYTTIYLYIHRIPYFLRWFKMYENRFLLLSGNDFGLLIAKWDNLLNFYFYLAILNTQISLWVNFYKIIVNLYLMSLDNEVLIDNNFKVTEYVLLNKKLLIID